MRPFAVLLLSIAPAFASPAIDVLLPPGSNAVFGLRTATLLNLLAQQESFRQLQQQFSALLAGTPWSGFNPFRDIQEIVLAATLNGKNPPTLAVITGHFDPAKLANGKGHPYRNAILIEDAKANTAQAILDETTMLAGDLALVKAAIDRASGPASASPLAARIETMRTRYDIWGFADHIDSATLPVASDPLQGLDRLWFGAAFSHNFELAAEFHFRSAKAAAGLTALVRDFEKQIKPQVNGAATFEMSTSDNSVTLAVSVPEQEWKKALQSRLQPAPKRGEPPRPQVVVTDSNGSTVTLSLPGKR